MRRVLLGVLAAVMCAWGALSLYQRSLTERENIQQSLIRRQTGPAGTETAKELDPELMPPVRLEADGKPIDTQIGHAAPFVGDFYGRGVNDLLVGQFWEGILWVYRNVGTNANPRFAAAVKFKDGKPDGRVPTG
jgi:hypothetical protein